MHEEVLRRTWRAESEPERWFGALMLKNNKANATSAWTLYAARAAWGIVERRRGGSSEKAM